MSFNPHIATEPDGLIIPEVRGWSLEKYKLVGGYCDIFTTGMKKKWDQLVYIDLFAGAGFSKIIETQQVVFSSSLIAMSIPNPFTKYILCEENIEKYNALVERVARLYPHLNVSFINGNSNEIIQQVKDEIPPYGAGNTLLSFCFVDPYSLNLHFNTIRSLGSGRAVDFLILQALHMDGNRNLNIYLNEQNDKISLYLGNDNWRDEFDDTYQTEKGGFVKFLADQYLKNMSYLRYVPEHNMHQIRSNDKNLPLYYLAFYSKHPRGIEFYKKVHKYLNPQLDLGI